MEKEIYELWETDSRYAVILTQEDHVYVGLIQLRGGFGWCDEDWFVENNTALFFKHSNLKKSLYKFENKTECEKFLEKHKTHKSIDAFLKGLEKSA